MEAIPERKIYNIWLKQDFKTDYLLTTGGDSVRIIYPGNLNINDGPDFQNARLLINGEETVGDIETHVESINWFKHGHNKDEDYDNVILHVVFNDNCSRFRTETFSSKRIPTLVISKYMTYHAPGRNSGGSDNNGRCAVKHTLPCYQLFQREGFSREKLLTILQSLGFQKLLEKLGSIKARIDRLPYIQKFLLLSPIIPNAAKIPAMNQLLYEKLMECMGYQANRIPFKILAENVSYPQVRKLRSELEIGSVLMAKAGLLDRYGNKKMMSLWRSLQAGFGPALNLYWSYLHSRPYNFPERRIIAASFVLNLTRRGIFAYFLRSLKKHRLNLAAKDLLDGMDNSARNIVGKNLLNTIIVNAVLPHLFFWSIIVKNTMMEKRIRDIYAKFPALPENNIIKKAKILLNVTDTKLLNTSEAQLGLFYLYCNFCSKFKCEVCPISQEFAQSL